MNREQNQENKECTLMKCARCGHVALIDCPLLNEICEECGRGIMIAKTIDKIKETKESKTTAKMKEKDLIMPILTDNYIMFKIMFDDCVVYTETDDGLHQYTFRIDGSVIANKNKEEATRDAEQKWFVLFKNGILDDMIYRCKSKPISNDKKICEPTV